MNRHSCPEWQFGGSPNYLTIRHAPKPFNAVFKDRSYPRLSRGVCLRALVAIHAVAAIKLRAAIFQLVILNREPAFAV